MIWFEVEIANGEAIAADRFLVPTKPVIATLLKVATPALAAKVVVPESTASETLKVMFWVDCEPEVTKLPSASRISATML